MNSRYEVEQDPKSRDTYYLNMGPQHPSTHGVMRIKLHLDGERIISAEPIIGYGHRAHEKMAENRDYIQFLPNPSRVDYLGGMIYNVGYCQAVERAMDIEVPERPPNTSASSAMNSTASPATCSGWAPF